MKSRIEKIEVTWSDKSSIRWREMRCWLGQYGNEDNGPHYIAIQDKDVKIEIPLEEILRKTREETDLWQRGV